MKNWKKKTAALAVILLAGSFTALSMTPVQVSAGEAGAETAEQRPGDALTVTGIETGGTSAYNGVFAKGILSRSEDSYRSHAVRGMYFRLQYSDGSVSDAISAFELKDNGISLILRDAATGAELPLDHEWVETGDYQLFAQYGSMTEKVMDLSVKAPGECADYTMTAGETIECANTSTKVSVIKVNADENAVYYLHYGEGSDSVANIIFVRDNEGNALSFAENVDQTHPAKLYLREGENYIYVNPQSYIPARISLEEKVISEMAMTTSPAEEYTLISTDEIGSLNDMWNLHSKMHDQMAFTLRYEDGTGEELSYEEFGKLWNYSIVTFSRKDLQQIDVMEKEPGVYYEHIYIDPEGYTWWDHPLAKVKFYLYDEFSDVSRDAWYHKYSAMASAEGVMTGMTPTTFGGTETLKRAHVATMLYRMAGSEEIAFRNTFPDVAAGQFYSEPVIWCNENGIVTGYTSNGYFGPSDDITREQMAVMLYRFAQYQGYDVSDRGELTSFGDAANVSGFAAEAMHWAVGAGIISGDNGLLKPQGQLIRAEAAAMIMRFINRYE